MDKKHCMLFLEDLPDILSAHGLQRALGIGRAGAYKLLSSGKIQSFKIGNTYKIPKSALIRYVESSCGITKRGETDK